MKEILKRADGSIRVVSTPTGGSLTQQQFKDQCCINNIMKKYHATGHISHLAKKQGRFADVSNLKDYQTSLQTVMDAQEAFQGLPSEVRKRFQNNPMEIVSFLADAKNLDEAIKLGLVEKKQTPAGDSTPAGDTLPSKTV